MMRSLALILMLALALSLAWPAAADCLRVDPARGEVRFEILQDGVPFEGRFTRFGGEVCFDGDSVKSVDVWLEPASVDTGLPELDAALQDPVLFHTAEHPRARFVSQDLRMDGDRHIADGELRLKGVARTLSVPFTVSDDDGARQVEGALDLMRLDHEVGTGEWSDTDLLSDRVRVSFRARLIETECES